MTWIVVVSTKGTSLVEHRALVSPSDTVVSRHASYPEACEALARYRDEQERAALREAGQKELFDAS